MAHDNGGSFMWFLAGLGLGALVGVLYAPRSGQETREAILGTAEEGREYVKTRSRQAREQVNRAVEKGREVLQDQKEHVRSAWDAGRQAYRDATVEAKPREGSD